MKRKALCILLCLLLCCGLLAGCGAETDNPQTADGIIEEQQMQFQVNLSDYDVRIGAGKMRLAVKDPAASRDAASKAAGDFCAVPGGGGESYPRVSVG